MQLDKKLDTCALPRIAKWDSYAISMLKSSTTCKQTNTKHTPHIHTHTQTKTHRCRGRNAVCGHLIVPSPHTPKVSHRYCRIRGGGLEPLVQTRVFDVGGTAIYDLRWAVACLAGISGGRECRALFKICQGMRRAMNEPLSLHCTLLNGSTDTNLGVDIPGMWVFHPFCAEEERRMGRNSRARRGKEEGEKEKSSLCIKTRRQRVPHLAWGTRGEVLTRVPLPLNDLCMDERESESPQCVD